MRERAERREIVPTIKTSSATLHTPTGDLPLQEYRLHLNDHAWSVLHTGAVLSYSDEQRFLAEEARRTPYGAALWPAAIALAHEVASRADSLAGARVLELGAGTGLPGIVAASFGARVLQTDRHAVALGLGRRNAELNAAAIEHRLADWSHWDDTERYDIILGSDILYAARLHPFLRRIFDTNLARHGRVLLADPFRATGLRLMEAMEADGWTISLSKWNVGEGESARPIGVYDGARNGH
jgi:methyltransferase-like protein 23